MKPDSEIGVAIRAGHPCYFVGFSPEPMPGQTIEDVCRAEAAFIEEVARRHPDAESKPIVIANCQAGWQTMMTAAIRPDLMGPIVVAGSPLSYWAGVRGKNPMRYTGGMLGGTWLTALSGDLGAGKFDGASLIANFEQLNPANTFWTKEYNVYSKVDTEKQRFLEFETYWGSPVLLNAGEMQWIVDNLFVGNKLSTGQIRTSDGVRVDLRNIKSPIVCFCSWGDNITPPQQALGLDSRPLRQRRRDRGQRSDHRLLAAPHDRASRHLRLGQGRFERAPGVRLVHGHDRRHAAGALRGDHHGGRPTRPRTANSSTASISSVWRPGRSTTSAPSASTVADDEKRFAAVARVSEVNLGLYRTFAEPWVRAMTTEETAEALRQMHPHRFRFRMFSDENPFMLPIKAVAAEARLNREPVSPDNPFLSFEKAASDWITTCLRIVGRGPRRDDGSDVLEYLWVAAYPGRGRPHGRTECGPSSHRARSRARERRSRTSLTHSSIASRPAARTRARFAH